MSSGFFDTVIRVVYAWQPNPFLFSRDGPGSGVAVGVTVDVDVDVDSLFCD